VQAKLAAREPVLAARHRLTAAARSTAATQLTAAVLDLVHRTSPRTVAAYRPIGDEPGGPDLVDALNAAVPTVLLPVLLPDLDLDWAPYTGTLRPGRFGLREPDSTPLGTAAIATADLVLVPALAVDRHGTRLGRGGGSYDRALARVPRTTPVIALLHDGELVRGRLPAEPHDRPVSAVITPSGGHTTIELG
jgi:5-formyltetrahydrofolate cyclo-ligase